MNNVKKWTLTFVLTAAIVLFGMNMADVKEVGAEEKAGIADSYIGVKTTAKVYDDFENDIWLQYQHKEMNVGDEANLYPWRVPQIVSNAIANDVQRPDFHFEIIKGDSITLNTEADESKGSDSSKAIVTAVKEGTSIVKVTYDEVTYKDLHFGASSEVNTAYAVFTVGEKGEAVIDTDEQFKNWLHYDTIYYNEGETTPYTFTVSTEKAVNTKVTVNGIEIKGTSDGKYTADLENRSNIIGIEAEDAEGKITSMYRVIDARFIKVNVENKTSDISMIQEGDTAVISFSGVTMPVYKLATIYNPQMGNNATYIAYNNEKLGDFKGKCSQWDLATKNSFEVTFDKGAGNYTFESDGIHCAWWGSKLGSDMGTEGQGNPNLNAPTLSGVFSVLPDFTVSVKTVSVIENINRINAYIADGKFNNIETMKMNDDTYKLVREVQKIYESLSQDEQEQIKDVQFLLNAIKAADDVLKNSQSSTEENKGGTVPSIETPAATPAVKVAKTKVKVKTAGKSVKISWKKVKKAKGYQIYRAKTKKGVYKKIKTIAKNKRLFIDKKVKRGKRYFYKVRAFRTVNGKRYYGNFSKKAMVRIK